MLNRFLQYGSEVVLFVAIILFFTTRTTDLGMGRVIFSDGLGYYSYLPAIFIYQDLEFDFYDKIKVEYEWGREGSQHTFINYYQGETANKYFAGTAVLWTPFFLTAHAMADWLGYAADGYSLPYQYAIAFAGLFFLWLGCRLVQAWLRLFSIPPIWIFLSLLGIVFGTNLLFYAVYNPAMTHVYSFALIAGFLYSLSRYCDHEKGKWLFWAAIFFGLITLVRPSNLIAAGLIPFVLGKRLNVDFLKRLFSQWKWLLLGSIIFIEILAIQSSLWYVQTGYFYVYSYANETFHFDDPHLLDILFSFRKGWWIYTPLALLSMIGLIPLFKSDRYRAIAISVFLLLLIYVLSSWEIWWYGGGFGLRAFVDYYSLLVFLLAIALEQSARRTWTKIALISAVASLVLLCLIQIYQYRTYILPYDGITAEIYKDNFLRLHPAARVYFYGAEVVSENHFKNNLEQEPMGHPWLNEITRKKGLAYSGKYSSYLEKGQEYGIGFKQVLDSLILEEEGLIKISARVWVDQPESNARLVAYFESNGYAYDRVEFSLKRYARAKEWTRVEFGVYTTGAESLSDSLGLYFWKPDKEQILAVDDVEISGLSLSP